MKKKLEKINFISAEDGKLVLHYDQMGVHKSKMSDNPIILADIMSKHGFADTVMASFPKPVIPPAYVVANCAAVPVIWVTAVAVTFTVVAAFTVFNAAAVTVEVATVIV